MANTIKTKAMRASILENIYDYLESKIRDEGCRYEEVGKKNEQAKDWRTGELKWDDDEKTIPHYDSIYDYVPIPESELDESTTMRIAVLRAIQDDLIKLI